MALVKQIDVSGRDYYRSLYASELDQEAEWLRRSAADKVDSIQRLLARRSILPHTLLELGCGTGAVIRECARRHLARRYIAVDYSPEAIGYLRSHAPGIEALQADITSPEFQAPCPVDVLVLTHVIEHLDDPDAFLQGTLRSLPFRYLLAEVPLEDLPGSRVRNWRTDRRVNISGHVQFFTATSFRGLLQRHGLQVLEQRRYVPIHSVDTIRFLRSKNQLSMLDTSRLVASALLKRALYPLLSQWHYAHFAVLCERQPRPEERPASAVEQETANHE